MIALQTSVRPEPTRTREADDFTGVQSEADVFEHSRAREVVDTQKLRTVAVRFIGNLLGPLTAHHPADKKFPVHLFVDFVGARHPAVPEDGDSIRDRENLFQSVRDVENCRPF